MPLNRDAYVTQSSSPRKGPTSQPVRKSVHWTLAECHMDVARFMAQYAVLRMTCPQCEVQAEHPTPVLLSRQRCEQCGAALDGLEWQTSGPVSHRLMQRLIRTCYRHPAFARHLLTHFRRDLDRSVAPEWGIDKGLLLVHAANAVWQRGHRSIWICVASLFGFFPLLALIPLWLMRRRDDLNLDCAEDFGSGTAYEPRALRIEHFPAIEQILNFTNPQSPYNVFYFRGFDTFDGLGQPDGSWSFLIDRRKRADGQRTDRPLALDANHVLDRIRERATRQEGPASFPGHFRTRDILMIRGTGLPSKDRRFLREKSRPYYGISQHQLEAERVACSPRARVYTQIIRYDPEHDVSVASYVRVEHRGAFTHIESIGRSLLPMSKRLMRRYDADPSPREYSAERKLPLWMRGLRPATPRRLHFLAWSFIALSLIWLLAGPYAAWISTSLVALLAIASYGYPLRTHDKFEPRARPLLLQLLLRRRDERSRLALIGCDEDRKEAGEFDYSPANNSIRASQSERDQTQLELADLQIARRSQELTIQHTFIECLAEAGIETADLRAASRRYTSTLVDAPPESAHRDDARPLRAT